jgi:tetratricopeptide (TPR) repeat protein
MNMQIMKAKPATDRPLLRARKAKQPQATPAKPPEAIPTAAEPAPEAPSRKLPPLFRKLDWLTFSLVTIAAFTGFFVTLAPEVTLEDSGELSTGAFYAGVPHPPGYPIWTVLAWAFTVLVPVANVAYRVAIASAVSGALAAGLLALITSRSCSMFIQSLPALRGTSRNAENSICLVSGWVAGLLLAYNGYMWSQSNIVEVYSFSVLSFMGVVCSLLRWVYAPHQKRYLYLAWFLFGICFVNHQTLILAAMGLEIAILAAKPKLGRDLLLLNSLGYILGLFALQTRAFGTFEPGQVVKIIFHLVGIGSLIGCAALSLREYLNPKPIDEKFTTEIVLPATSLLLGVLVGSLFFLFHLGLLAGLTSLCILGLWVHFRFKHQSQVLSAFGMMMSWLLGAAFFFYMPLTSMSNPPMNWGYPRTVDGFVHVLMRGQYEKIAPTNFLQDPGRLFMQIKMYLTGANEQFNPVFLMLVLVPFFFFRRLQKRERAWLTGLSVIWVCLALLLMILLNPSSDRASVDLTKVFFTASYTMLCMLIGYALALMAAFMVTQYDKFRPWGIVGGGVAAALALWSLAESTQDVRGGQPTMNGIQLVFQSIRQSFAPDQDGMGIHAGLLLLGLAVVFVLLLAVSRTKALLPAALAVFALLPVHSFLSHWSDNEERNHWFGYWFGHDMFTPPFVAPDGKLSYDAKLREQAMKGANGNMVYPEITRDAILFGGTDPGRFCPTYMIFCDSQIPHDKQPAEDQHFDRRDVYIITQNALADPPYLNYIRAHYNRSTQKDAPFFQELLRSTKEKEQNYKTNILARIAYEVLDRPFLGLGAKIEAQRRAEGLYPSTEIHTPTPEDSQECFQAYIGDAERRWEHDMRVEHDLRFPNEPRQLRPGEDPNRELKPGEDVKAIDQRVQVAGQVAVMSINGLLTKVIFDHNPSHEFFVEESAPLDWMYPYLTPFGIIMKINRQQLPELGEDIVKRDHEFWSQYSQRLIGNWITYDTSIKEIADFVQKVYVRHDFSGFEGDRKFVRDDPAQKSFSKLRTSIGGVYNWRIANAHTTAEQQRMYKEADFAFKQAFAFCPYSPEVVLRYVQLLANFQRVDDAILLAETCHKLDPNNASVDQLLNQLKGLKSQHQGLRSTAGMPGVPATLDKLEVEASTKPDDFQASLNLASAYVQLQQRDKAVQVLDKILVSPKINPQAVIAVVQAYVDLKEWPRLEGALVKLTQLAADSPEAWYDLAALEANVGKTNDALTSLRRSSQNNARRLAQNPTASNLMLTAQKDGRFDSMRQLPEVRELLGLK